MGDEIKEAANDENVGCGLISLSKRELGRRNICHILIIGAIFVRRWDGKKSFLYFADDDEEGKRNF